MVKNAILESKRVAGAVRIAERAAVVPVVGGEDAIPDHAVAGGVPAEAAAIVSVSLRNGEPVQDGAGRRVRGFDVHYVFAVAHVQPAAVDVPAQDRGMGRPIALIARHFVTGEATV